MTLKDRISQDMATAMRAKDQPRLMPLRMAKAAIVNREVEKGRDLDEAEAQQVVASLIKQRRDSIEQFRLGDARISSRRKPPKSPCSSPTCRRRSTRQSWKRPLRPPSRKPARPRAGTWDG